jgi:hypothetical protein
MAKRKRSAPGDKSGSARVPVPADEKIARLLAMLLVKDIKKKTDKVPLLRSAGFEVSEVASMLGMTENHVTVADHVGRKRRRLTWAHVAKINQALLQRLANKLGVSGTRIYQLLQKVSVDNRVPRHLGALLLAGNNGISVQKYASPAELAELRGIPSHTSVTAASTTNRSTPIHSQRASPKRRPKTKENTVFVVHGRDSKLRDSMYELLGWSSCRVFFLRSQQIPVFPVFGWMFEAFMGDMV